MQPITFGAAYFFTKNYLDGYDKQKFALTRQEDQLQFINHLVQVTGDSDIYSNGFPQAAERAMINHPQLGEGFAVVTDKVTNNFRAYSEAKLNKTDYYVDGRALVRALDQATKRSELQRFNTFSEDSEGLKNNTRTLYEQFRSTESTGG